MGYNVAMLNFRKISSPSRVSNFLFKIISENLERGQKVLLLVTGGSTMPVIVELDKKLAGVDLSNLVVSLIDERFGPVGHENSNWAQLKSLGFKFPSAKLEPILKGLDFKTTVENYDKFLTKTYAEVDYKIGFTGIGPDSHIAGIKPRSPAIEADAMAFGYDWDDYKGRITMTFKAITMLDCAITYLAGESKRQAIENLQKDMSLEDCPSQILKSVKQAIIFNDIYDSPSSSSAQSPKPKP